MRLPSLFQLLPITLGLLATPAPATLVFGGFNGDRVDISSLSDGYIAEELRQSIATAFPGSTFTGTDLLSMDYLNLVDCLIIGAPGINRVTYLTSEEQMNLLNYVKGGGGLIIFSDNDEHVGKPESDNAAETFLDPFGVDGTGHIGGQQRVLPTDLDHPVINGRFGRVEVIATYFSGWFDGFGSFAVPIASYEESGEAAVLAIEHNKLGPGSGGVVFIGDAELLIDSTYGGYIATEDNKTFLLNAIAYVIPEPSVASAAAVGLAVLAGRRRRKG